MKQHIKDLKIAYIGGGSHAWAWVFMTDLSKETSISGTVRLYDIDREAAHDNDSLVSNSHCPFTSSRENSLFPIISLS